jgi:hypothetical protein
LFRSTCPCASVPEQWFSAHLFHAHYIRRTYSAAHVSHSFSRHGRHRTNFNERSSFLSQQKHQKRSLKALFNQKIMSKSKKRAKKVANNIIVCIFALIFNRKQSHKGDTRAARRGLEITDMCNLKQ